jgi:hypothetical protein
LVVILDDMTTRVLTFAVVVLLVVGIPTATAQSTSVVRLGAEQDVSLPFWCEWGYDSDERCYRDGGDRLPIGGDEDKVWRAALRFPMSGLPAGAAVVQASLFLFHDARCLGPRKTSRPCESRAYELEAHPILSTDWFHERELESARAVAGAQLPSADREQWLAFDLTDLVAGWVDGSRRNAGILLKLSDAEENYGVSGPKPPSSSFTDPALRPRLEVTYVGPTG